MLLTIKILFYNIRAAFFKTLGTAITLVVVSLSCVCASLVFIPPTFCAEQAAISQDSRTISVIPDDNSVYVLYGLAGIGALAIILVLWYYMLLKRVMARTSKLQETLNELRKSEEALRLSNEKFSMLFASSPDSIVITEADGGKFIEVNERFLKLLGYTREDVNGKTVLELDIWADPAERKVFRRLLGEKGPVNSFETTLRTRQGSIVPCLISGRTIEIEGVPHIISVVADISQIRLGEAELRRAKEFVETIFNSIHDAVAIINVDDFAIVDANRFFIEQTGLPREELLGRTCHEITHGANATCDFYGEVCPIALMMKTRSACTLEHLHHMKDGRNQYVEVTAAPVFDAQGALVQAVYMTKDITERKNMEVALQESEKRFRDLSDNAVEWVWETDDKGKYTYSNDTVEKMLGYTKDEILQRHIYDLFVPHEQEELKRKAFEAFAKKQPLRGFISKNMHKNGEIVWMSTNGVPLIDESGMLAGFRGADVDITERMMIEEEREKLLCQLREALSKVKALSGMLPICASCKKIKDDKGYWNRLEEYVRDHSEAEFSHGLCPDCEKKAYQELEKLKKQVQ